MANEGGWEKTKERACVSLLRFTVREIKMMEEEKAERRKREGWALKV